MLRTERRRENSENADCNFLESKMTYLDVLFCLTNRPKTPNILFTVTYDTEKQEILSLVKLKPEIYPFFLLKND